MTNEPMFAAYDLETTGIYPDYNEIVEIAIILLDYKLREIDRFVSKVLPDYENRVHPKARAINGYDRVVWKKQGAVNQIQLASKLVDFFNKYTIDYPLINIGHRIQFDMGFMDILMKKNVIKLPIDYRRCIDTLVLEEVVRMLEYKNKSGKKRRISPKNFDGLMEIYGVVAPRVNGKHGAESDIDATLDILQQQLRKFENGINKNIFIK